VSKEWRLWANDPPTLPGDRLIDLTRDPVHLSRWWTQAVGDMRPEANVGGLYWRPSVQDARSSAPKNLDALGAPMKAGEMYVSSRHGMIPVSVEGVRFLIDKEGEKA
jgi:hypothetical protein